MADKKLLEVKRTLKRKQPVFKRQQSGRKKVGTEWRRPKGLHSKMKDGLKGYPKARRMGYRTPVAVRGMTGAGLIPVRVENIAQLAVLDPKTHAIVLGKVGARKKIMLIEQAKGFTFVNADAKTAAVLKERFDARTQAKKAAQAKKEAAKKAAKKKASVEDKVAEASEKDSEQKAATPADREESPGAETPKAEKPTAETSDAPKKKTARKKAAKKE